MKNLIAITAVFLIPTLVGCAPSASPDTDGNPNRGSNLNPDAKVSPQARTSNVGSTQYLTLKNAPELKNQINIFPGIAESAIMASGNSAYVFLPKGVVISGNSLEAGNKQLHYDRTNPNLGNKGDEQGPKPQVVISEKTKNAVTYAIKNTNPSIQNVYFITE